MKDDTFEWRWKILRRFLISWYSLIGHKTQVDLHVTFNTSLFDDLEMYVNDIQVGTTALDGEPEVVNETSATALVQGNNLLGPVNSYM